MLEPIWQLVLIVMILWIILIVERIKHQQFMPVAAPIDGSSPAFMSRLAIYWLDDHCAFRKCDPTLSRPTHNQGPSRL